MATNDSTVFEAALALGSAIAQLCKCLKDRGSLPGTEYEDQLRQLADEMAADGKGVGAAVLAGIATAIGQLDDDPPSGPKLTVIRGGHGL